MPQHRFARLLITISIVGAIGGIVACDSGTASKADMVAPSNNAVGAGAAGQRLLDHPPGEQDVRNAAQSRNCDLIAIQSISWPDDTYRVPASYDDAKVVYEADCKPDGGDQIRRITYEAQFAAVTSVNTGNAKPFWKLTLNQPARGEPAGQAGSSNAVEQDAALGTYADGPECNALLIRVQSEVIPCVEDIDANAARRIQSWLEITSQRSRIAAGGSDGNRDAAELKIDENCLASWQSSIARDFGGSSPFATCAPE